MNQPNRPHELNITQTQTPGTRREAADAIAPVQMGRIQERRRGREEKRRKRREEKERKRREGKTQMWNE